MDTVTKRGALAVHFHILGPVEARVDGVALPLGGTKPRTVLAALLLARGQVVRDSRLSHLLWRDQPPVTANAQIYTYISRLRKIAENHVFITRHGQGYALTLGHACFDHQDFEQLARRGREELAAGRFDQASSHLRAALALWHGPALTDVTEYLLDEELGGLEEGRVAALEGRIDADLALDRHESVVAELVRLVGQYPLRERFRAQLMTALHRCGRQAEALAVYHEGRKLLADELGVDPDERLRATYHSILAGRSHTPTLIRA